MQVCPFQDTEACIPKSEMQALLFDSGDWRVAHIIKRESDAARVIDQALIVIATVESPSLNPQLT